MTYTLSKIGCALLCAWGALSAGTAFAQDYPNRNISLVMPYAAGGPGDIVARIFAGHLQKTLGQTVVVDNTSGASGSIGSAKVARAKPDGYTLLMIHVSHATNPVLLKNLSYNPVTDFEPIGSATEGPMVLVARKDFPAKDLQEFVAYVKANASKLSIGQAGVGSASHLCALMFMNALGVSLTEVPYKGSAPALNDVMGSQLDMVCDQTSTTLPAIQGGKVKAYAAAGKSRLASMPDVPALGEAGVKGFDISISFGIYAPKGTPPAVVDKLVGALQAALRDPDIKARLEGMGVAAVAPERGRPEALRAHLKNEMDSLGPLLIKSGVQAN
jgi:tripartite-type tricarboxylate transporter receptor subunit TctC